MRGEFQATGARSLRGALELMLRAIALAALAFVLWSELTRAGAGAATRVLSADSASVVPTLARLSRDPAVASAHLTMSSTPDAATRDWLRALRGAGVDLGWSGPLPPAMVLAAEPVPSALPRVRLAVASPVPVIVSDEVGAIDTLPEGGGAIIVAGVQGAVEARGAGGAGGAGETGGRIAATRLADSLLVRRVLVLGMAGWETKFVTAALEEGGWDVDARFGVAPTATVVQGSVSPDTSRHSAVVVVDSSAAPHAAAVARFARSGGGVVLLPGSLALSAMRGIAAGPAGATLAAEDGMLTSEEPRHGLALVPVASTRPGVSIIEERDGRVAIAARRVGSGRVAQAGYLESWRWRLAGSDAAPAAHRSWWSELVGGVAHAPALPIAAADPWQALDDAPAARLIAALGPPTPAPQAASPDTGDGPRRTLRWWLFALAAGALLLEWGSRRSRGLP